MAIALVAHAGAASANSSTATTAGIDTTGANLLVASIAFIDFGGSNVVTDSNGNTWTALTEFGGSGASRAEKMFYCVNPTVGAGHTFTGSAPFPSVCVAAFSGADSTPFDQESGAVGSVQPGSITPAGDNELFVTGIACTDAGTQTIDQGFSVTDSVGNGANNIGCALAYLIQTTGAAQNPSWNPGSSGRTAMATFKASAGGGGGFVDNTSTILRCLLGGGLAC